MTTPVRYHEGKFPPTELAWSMLAEPLARASDAIARYDSFLGIIPNPDILIAPLLTQEAVTSSRIEGTRATFGDVLEYEAGNTDVDPTKANDIREIINYRIALRSASDMIREIPISGRVIKNAHGLLMEGVRGQFKSPGKYRTDQNWIGLSNDIEEARYIPIKPENVEDAMSKWERYVNESKSPSLIKVAVAHAEFESIHPFKDGNGRIGRILVPLMLQADGLISSPCFYLSEFFEYRNSEYQDMLLAVSRDNAWTSWCRFFLEAVATQAKENDEKAKGIYRLYEETKRNLLAASNSASAGLAADYLFMSPIFPASRFTTIPDVPPKTGRRLLNVLKEMGVVEELSPHRGQRPAILIFPELMRITEGVSVHY